jgi:osmotically-inducible protein OsmY
VVVVPFPAPPLIHASSGDLHASIHLRPSAVRRRDGDRRRRFAVLQQDKDLQALPLTVSSTAAGVVVVKGSAPSAELAQKAIKLVQAVPGVKEVRNEIKVG